MRLNRAYVEEILRYFSYRETWVAADRARLAAATARLEEMLGQYEHEFGLFDVRAIRVLLGLAKEALRDVQKLEDRLRSAPTDADLEEMFRKRAEAYRHALAKAVRPRTLYVWKGTVDGADLFHFRGDSLQIDHQSWEYPRQTEFRCLAGYDPAKEKLVVRMRRGRGNVIILDGSTPECIDVYVEDPLPGSDVFHFEIVAVPTSEEN